MSRLLGRCCSEARSRRQHPRLPNSRRGERCLPVDLHRRFAIRTHNPEANGAPGGPAIPTPDSARIYPGESGLEYCQQGWHVITIGVFDDPTLSSGGNKEAHRTLSAVDIQFALDSEEVARGCCAPAYHRRPGHRLEDGAHASVFGCR
jgi:hypothetical protein